MPDVPFDAFPPVPDAKRARSDHPLLPAIAARWSPRAFDPARPLAERDVLPLLEAARWAASANNLQPWRLPWALRGEGAFAALLACLAPGNAAWAGRAGVLLLGCTVLAKPDGSPNRHAAHDLGAALAQLALQAAVAGIGVHLMGGFDPARARDALGVPDGVEPYTAVALGWPGAPASLDEPARAREVAPRERRPLAEVAPRGGGYAPRIGAVTAETWTLFLAVAAAAVLSPGPAMRGTPRCVGALAARGWRAKLHAPAPDAGGLAFSAFWREGEAPHRIVLPPPGYGDPPRRVPAGAGRIGRVDEPVPMAREAAARRRWVVDVDSPSPDAHLA